LKSAAKAAKAAEPPSNLQIKNFSAMVSKLGDAVMLN
jgi:hypothetical protein